jgi:hypothetical protein
LSYYETHSAPNKGIPHSQATREKIRQSALKAGGGKWNKGRKMTGGDKIAESQKKNKVR